MTEYSDLKLIDELLCDLQQEMSSGGDPPIRAGWIDVEDHSSVTRAAMKRLREAWKHDEMPLLTLSLANYFRSVKEP